MTFKDVVNEMRANGVAEEDIKTILEQSKKSRYNPKLIDEELEKMGYEKIFTIDYDDNYDDDDDIDDFPSSQKIFRKHNKEF
ncbi:MAG: hypothetical protein R3331_04105 [Sulfurospirillaceae bacterium]|nr:hypothetical protein [Sulfurospirillaceae bacterium]